MDSLSGLQTGIYDFRINKCFVISTITILVYDYLLTLSDEISMIWKKRVTIAGLAYSFNRIMVIIVCCLQVNNLFIETRSELCRGLIRAMADIHVVAFIVGELMLSIRIYALWMGDKRVLAFLALIISAGCGIAIWDANNTTIVQMNILGRGCAFESIDRFFVGYIVLLLLESTFLSLMLVKTFRTLKKGEAKYLSSLLIIIVRDGINYYFSVVLLALTSLVISTQAPTGLKTIFVVMHCVLHSILCARLMLRLHRKFTEKELESDGLSPFSSLSSSSNSSQDDTGLRTSTSMNRTFLNTILSLEGMEYMLPTSPLEGREYMYM